MDTGSPHTPDLQQWKWWSNCSIFAWMYCPYKECGKIGQSCSPRGPQARLCIICSTICFYIRHCIHNHIDVQWMCMSQIIHLLTMLTITWFTCSGDAAQTIRRMCCPSQINYMSFTLEGQPLLIGGKYNSTFSSLQYILHPSLSNTKTIVF